MKKKIDVIPTGNYIRITDEEVLAKINEDYERKQGDLYGSRNAYFNRVLEVGIDVLTKQRKDDWAIKNETTILLDAIHEHTKRMNFFIKFSQPFIKKSYANLEINERLLCIMFNYLVERMDEKEQKLFFQNLQEFSILPEKFAEQKMQMQKYYDYKTE